MYEESYRSMDWRMCEWTVKKGQIQNVIFGLSLFFFFFFPLFLMTASLELYKLYRFVLNLIIMFSNMI